MAEASQSILERLDEHLLAAMHDGHTEQHRSDVSVVELSEACQKMHEDQAEIERLRARVKELGERNRHLENGLIGAQSSLHNSSLALERLAKDAAEMATIAHRVVNR